MTNWHSSPDNWSEQDGFYEASSASRSITSSNSSHTDLSHQPGAQGTATSNLLGTNLGAQHSIPASSTASTVATGSDPIPYMARDGLVVSVLPRFLASREPGAPLSLASSLDDPILEAFICNTPSPSPTASHIGQTASPSTSSSSADATESNETHSGGEECHLRGGDGGLGTPATSDATLEADDIFDLDYEDEATLTPNGDPFLGLELSEEYQDKPLFCEGSDDHGADVLDEILHEFRKNDNTNFQTRPDAIPWVPSAEDDRWPNLDEGPVAPPPGPAYDQYYSSIRRYKKIQRKVILARDQPRPTSRSTELSYGGLVTEPFEFGQCSRDWIKSQGGPSEGWRNNDLERIPKIQLQPIYRLAGSSPYSLETLVSIFHPSFLVAHLSRSSVVTFTNEVHAPNSLVYNPECTIDFFLGFGPPISLDVCTFTPRDDNALLSYKRKAGNTNFDAQRSLPIVLNIFSVESIAEDINTWLDEFINSKSGLLEYVDLILRRQPGHYSAQMLEYLVSWFVTSKSELSEPVHQIFSTALKLLMTTTLLSLVPRIVCLPESLLCQLPRPRTTANPSTEAPKLLTRQIKASIYHLQQNLLHALLYYFSGAVKLIAEAKVAVALLAAFVLELVRNAGREFAEFTKTVNSMGTVNPEELKEYEANMKTQVFDRVRASVFGVAGGGGKLGEKLRNLRSIVKGKGIDTQDCQFVYAILDAVV